MNRRPVRLSLYFLAAGLALLFWLFRPAPVPPPKAVRDPHEVEQRLQAAVAASARLSLRAIGEIRYGEFSSPLWAITYTPASPPKSRGFLAGGTHGNEPAGTEVLLRLVEELAQERESSPRMALDIVPLVNPWGWAHNRRRNGDQRDINRDFVAFKTQEARLLRNFVSNTRYDLAVDCHEDSRSDGFYLYQYVEYDPAVPRTIIARVRNAGMPIDKKARFLTLKSDDGLIQAPEWTLSCARTARLFSLGNYMAYNDRSRHAYTVETPSRLPLDTRLSMHRIALDRLLETRPQ